MDKTLFLFVPATRLDWVSKAKQSKANAIIIDLEDAVADDQKNHARTALMALDAKGECGYWLRINAVHSMHHLDDITCMLKLNHLLGVVLPKCQNKHQVESVYHHIHKPVIAMIETAVGMANIANIAHADGLWAMSFGRLDLMYELGVQPDSPASQLIFDKIRTDLLIHSVANGLHPPIETIFNDFEDETGLAACVRHWCDFGFAGQMMIHPKQIAVADGVLTAQAEQMAFAHAICQKYQKTGETVFAIDGKMVDLPLINWAKNLIKVAKN